MRYLVLTDIHANLEALESCLADAHTRAFDRTLVLGDLVGYGADPNRVIERVQALKPAAIVRGNHDKVACGLEQADGFNPVAKSGPHGPAGLVDRAGQVGRPGRCRARPVQDRWSAPLRVDVGRPVQDRCRATLSGSM